MAEDFRTLLVEQERKEGWGRSFKEIKVGGVFNMSVQASEVHGSTPEQTLDDVMAYEAFEVTLSQCNGPFISHPSGAWDYLVETYEWPKTFERGMIANSRIKEYVPVADVQQVYEDLIKYAKEKA